MSRTSIPDAKLPSIPNLTDDLEYSRAFMKESELRVLHEGLDVEIKAAEAALQDGGRSESVARLADELLSDSPRAEQSVRRTTEELRGLYLRRQAADLALRKHASTMASVRVAASRRLCADLSSEVVATVREFAETLARSAELADHLGRFFSGLDNAGLAWTGVLPPLALAPWRSGVVDSRVNLLLSQIERDYGIKVDRLSLAAMIAARDRRDSARHAQDQKHAEERAAREREARKKAKPVGGVPAELAPAWVYEA